jgi:cell wall-associated NlpC family hydrolase
MIRGNAAGVVQTALDAIGTPYRWGGRADNGFDCSGLIQYAYGEQGILLPRRSRDQVRTGTLVETEAGSLRPGDILGFAENGRRVSHVGLYIGDGAFIHSSSSGVRLSSLTSDDPYSQWWQARWVTARRVLE